MSTTRDTGAGQPPRGRFITLEGIDGAGKSTHAAWLKGLIEQQGYRVVGTREPGGTPLGESLRHLLLHDPMSHESEALLMFAARREHILQVIEPALARGDWVLCDRFTDATYAYQGGGHGVAPAHIAALEKLVHPGLEPDLTFLFDVPTSVSRERLERAHAQGRDLDKFEREETAFFQRVRDAYMARARDEPARFRIVDAARPLAAVQADLRQCIDTL